MMKLGADDCPRCGNLYSFVSGASAGVGCRVDGCEAGFATSNLPALAPDDTDYTCYVERLPENWMPAVAWLCNRFQMPAAQARNYRYDSTLPLITRKASELFYLRREFDEHGIEIRIAPDFNYPNDRVQSDGERPLTEDELQVICGLIDIKRNTEKPRADHLPISFRAFRPTVDCPFVSQSMRFIATAVTASYLLFAGCEKSGNLASSDSGTHGRLQQSLSVDDLLQIRLPSLAAQNRKLSDVLPDLNKRLSDAVNGDSRGEIVVVRSHPRIDNGAKVLSADIPAGTLAEQLRTLTAMTLTHWIKSENGYLVFRTWHRPQYDFDDDAGLLAPER